MGKSKEIVNRLNSLGLLKVRSIKELMKSAAENGRDLIQEAVVAGVILPDALPFLFSENFDISFLDLKKEDLDPSLSSVIPSEMAWGEEIVPLSMTEGYITLGVLNPLKSRAYRWIENHTGKKVKVALVGENSLKEALRFLFPPPLYLSRDTLSGELSRHIDIGSFLARKDSASLVSKILYIARIAGVHILTCNYILGKFVVDGKSEGGKRSILLQGSKDLGEFIFSGLRMLCGFSKNDDTIREFIVETGKENRSGMYKVAFVSGAGSNKAVIRVVPDALGKLSLDGLGFGDEQLEAILNVIEREKGLYLIASPTHDGVATTLYSMVRYAQSPDCRVVALEEDIRYKNEGFIQIEKGMTGSRQPMDKIIRALAPDILMVDNLSFEELEEEMARITPSRVSVFAGLQCGDLESALDKVLNAEISPYHLASSLKLIAFQKLVRLLCPLCKKELPAIPSAYLHDGISESAIGHLLMNLRYYIPTGCEECSGSGYIGQTALFDVIVFSPSARMEILQEKGMDQKRENILSNIRLGPEEKIFHMLAEGEITFEEAMPFIKPLVERELRG